MRGRAIVPFALLLCIAVARANAQSTDLPTRARNVFAQRCFECHSADRPKSGMRLDLRDAALKGGDASTTDIIPGKSAGSDLIKRITSNDPDEMMPPKGERLTSEQVSLLKTWIDAGANWPVEAHPATTEPSVAVRPITPEQRAYWAYQPVHKPDVPSLRNPNWVSTPIDAFVLAKLQSEGLELAPPASKLELIRRVCFDLTGLPPTTSEIDMFVNDPSDNAYEKMVDRFLDSPHYGEQWGQHWLDVVRFGESEGFEYDTPVISLWQFRDYVIKAFNDDKPYDRFLTEQLAGDELDPNNQECQIAAGFHRLGPVRRNKGNQDVASSRNEVLTDRTDVVAAAFMGMTMGCARCHDHKFDPISQKDYYSLQAFLASTDANDIVLAPPEDQQVWKQKTNDMNRQIARLKRQLTTVKDEEKPAIQAQIDKLEDDAPPPLPGINTIKDVEPTEIHVLRRGDWDKKADAVGMRPPSVLVSMETPEEPLTTSNPRLKLAQWLIDPKQPLTARVMVNRVWQGHFGKGIVKTANDYGLNGDKPSNQPLLDYLASVFVENGWHIKPLHKLIMMSSAYRQSSENTHDTAVGTEKDPDDRWLWHFDRRRLTAEEIRDSMLVASGKFNAKPGGDSIFIPVDPELVNALYKPSQWAVTRDTSEHYRRSIYLVAKRNLRLPSMEVFDEPTLGASCPRRESSTHAPQALELLNGTMSNGLAEEFAQRLLKEAGTDPAAQVELAFRLATGRAPTEQERRLGVEFLQGQSLKEFSLAMFNLNAFLYVN